LFYADFSASFLQLPDDLSFKPFILELSVVPVK